MQDETDGAGAPQGLSWSWELDFATLMECLTEPGPHDAPGCRLGSAPPAPGRSPASAGGASADGGSTDTASAGGASADGGSADTASAGGARDHAAGQGGRAAMQGAVPGDSIDLGDPDDLGVPGDRVPAGVLAGRVAERLAPGPDLAAWLSLTPAAELGDADLAAIAGGWRRLASWAQSRELAAVAQIASRAAARDADIGTGEDGRPLRVPASAAAEVALELTMSRHGAAGWADLAVDLGWRLAATSAALESGNIDLYRARLIAEATGMLTDDTARAVEEKVLPAAGSQTPGMLRAALRRAVIIADPRGAEERRRNAERQAKVVLYPDEDHTATLAGQRLPAIGAAAAMARIKAMARAWKASGAAGGTDLLSAKIYLGLLLGTLPLIPPPEGAPPDNPPGNDPGGPSDPSDPGDPGGGPEGNTPGNSVSGDEVPPPGDQDAPGDQEDYPCPSDSPAGPGGPAENAENAENDGWQDCGPPPDWPGLPVIPPAFARPVAGGAGPVSGLLDVSLPWRVLAGASDGPGYLGRIGPVPASQARQLADCAVRDPAAEWRIIITTPAGQAIAVTRIPRPPGVGGLRQPGTGPGAGLVGRVTLTISEDILTRAPPGTGSQQGPGPGPDPRGQILRLALHAAARAAARAHTAAAADAAAGRCAHTAASPGYRPPPRLRDHVTARDLTCRSPVCRQPAWRGELDHTIPWDQGPTCTCNLGGVCKADHLIKHHPDWKLAQTAPGMFTWTTPSGRIFTATPDTHPL